MCQDCVGESIEENVALKKDQVFPFKSSKCVVLTHLSNLGSLLPCLLVLMGEKISIMA